MDAAQLIGELAFQERLPVEAIRAASADRARAAPIFVHAIEQFVSPDGDRTAKDSLFFIFHLFGEWHEKSAYRPLARLMRCSRDDVDEILGGAITDTTHRVMAAVFDGDPGPLCRAPKQLGFYEHDIRSSSHSTNVLSGMVGRAPSPGLASSNSSPSLRRRSKAA